MEQQRVSPRTRRQTRDGGGCAAENARDLAMGGAVDETRRDGAGERAEEPVGEAAGSRELVLWAIGAGAERGGETALNLDRLNWPAHARV